MKRFLATLQPLFMFTLFLLYVVVVLPLGLLWGAQLIGAPITISWASWFGSLLILMVAESLLLKVKG